METWKFVIGKFNGLFIETGELQTLVDTGSTLTSSLVDIFLHVLYALHKKHILCINSPVNSLTEVGAPRSEKAST